MHGQSPLGLIMLAVQARNLPPPPVKLPEKPEQYGVYRGQVANIIDLGCFVELHGFPSRQEGLVHVSNISKTRSAVPSSSAFCPVANLQPCSWHLQFICRPHQMLLQHRLHLYLEMSSSGT